MAGKLAKQIAEIMTILVEMIVRKMNLTREKMTTKNDNFAELIFVTNITNNICGEKIVMWRYFGKFWRNFGKFWEILGDFATIYPLSCGEKLSQKSSFVEKK